MWEPSRRLTYGPELGYTRGTTGRSPVRTIARNFFEYTVKDRRDGYRSSVASARICETGKP
jgi:hypothetical protein